VEGGFGGGGGWPVEMGAGGVRGATRQWRTWACGRASSPARE
jgi:hypothetical protein